MRDREAVNGGQRARDVHRLFRRFDVKPQGAGAGADLDTLSGVFPFKKFSIRL